MLPLLTAAQMRACDEYTIQKMNIPSQTLMERAARAAIDILKTDASFALTDRTRLVVLCGNGNNGGDGFAMARFLFDDGIDSTVCYAGEWKDDLPDTTKMSIECARQYTLWRDNGGQTNKELPPLNLAHTIVVDALFGIGLCREITGLCADWICQVNSHVCTHKIPVLALDTPSGVQADTGKVLGCAMRATVTATIGEIKRGLLLYPAAEYVGKLYRCDIGISTEGLHDMPQVQPLDSWYWTASDVVPYLQRPAYSHKGTFGRVLVIGGCPGMCGASYFAAKSAYRAGAGLVEVFTAEANRIPLQTLLPEAILSTFDAVDMPTDEQLAHLLDRADSVVLGCGLGQGDVAHHITKAALHFCQKPLVVDADALNLIAAHEPLQALLAARTAPTVLTPHMGEASRLCHRTTEEIASDLFATSAALAARYHAVCVLKDARTIISDGKNHFAQPHGNSGMATAGSGDCLAGLIGSLLAQHRTRPNTRPVDIATLGILIHAMAGDFAADHLGQHAVMASDIADAIGAVLRTPLPSS